MTTLANATLALARIITNVMEGTATGGSTTTLVDTARYEPEDYFDEGTIWFLSGNNVGKSAQILTWTLSTTTFTFATLLAVVATDRYAAASPEYPRYLLRQKINEALQQMGVPQRNTALTTVNDQAAYDLPAGVYNVRRVEVATLTSAPYDYQVYNNWREIGSQIVFDEFHLPTGGYTIRLTYEPQPTELTLDADTIDNRIQVDHLVWKAAVGALRWRIGITREDEPEKVRQINEALATAERMAGMWPLPKVNRDARLGGW